MACDIIDSMKKMYKKSSKNEGLTISKFAKQSGVCPNSVRTFIQNNQKQLGEIKKYKSKDAHIGIDILSPAQQQFILSNMPLLKYPVKPSGYVTLSQVAKDLGITYAKVASFVKEHQDVISDLKQYRESSRPAIALSPEQQEYLKTHVDEICFSGVPAGYQDLKTFAKQNNVSYMTILKYVSEHKKDLGEIETFLVSTIKAKALSKDQQQYLQKVIAEIKRPHDNTKSNAVFDKRPDGYLTIHEFAEKNQLNYRRVNRYVIKYISEIEKLPQLRSGKGMPGRILSPNQQRILLESIARECH